MIAIWYAVVSFMLIIYIVLDGRNFGAGMLQWFVAKTPEERRQVIAAIGPLWTWHEVWLLGFGGTLIAIFPRLMASAFAGYYLALFLILWCLILRGISIEVGGHINDRLWQAYWDFIFVCSNFLLAILFGAAAGNVARGVPVERARQFLDGVFHELQCARPCRPARLVHGIDCDSRCRNAGGSWRDVSHAQDRRPGPRSFGKIGEISLDRGCSRCFFVVLIESRIVRPDLPGRALSNPFWWIGLVVIAISIIALVSGLTGRRERRAFLASNFLIVGLLATGAAAIFPVMLHSTLAPENSLTAYAVAFSPALCRAAFGGRSVSRWRCSISSSSRDAMPER